MHVHAFAAIEVAQKQIKSNYLGRTVTIDVYVPKNSTDPAALSLLLINDGQNLAEMGFTQILNGLIESNAIQPLLCVGIPTGEERKMEYGTAKVLDYEGRGARAAAYQLFITEELIPCLHLLYGIERFAKTGIAGFSLGGLSALDTVWNHPHLFSVAGVFSGSLWWRTKNLDDGYNEETDRIMHQQVKEGGFHPGLKFYFTTGSMDETADRNNNGIIDSIDDTLGLIAELEKKGYDSEIDIKYINYEDGKHDIATWGRAMPSFLLWGWSRVTHQPITAIPESC
jgi:iron(III)-enterobactin esterase